MDSHMIMITLAIKNELYTMNIEHFQNRHFEIWHAKPIPTLKLNMVENVAYEL